MPPDYAMPFSDFLGVEHAIMCQYLFAAFWLKQRAEEGLTPAELDAVTRWRRTIAHVAPIRIPQATSASPPLRPRRTAIARLR